MGFLLTIFASSPVPGVRALEQLGVSQAAGRMELWGIMVGMEGNRFTGENCPQVGEELTPVLLRKLLW